MHPYYDVTQSECVQIEVAAAVTPNQSPCIDCKSRWVNTHVALGKMKGDLLGILALLGFRNQ